MNPSPAGRIGLDPPAQRNYFAGTGYVHRGLTMPICSGVVLAAVVGVSMNYAYAPIPDRPVAVRRGDRLLTGTLDITGELRVDAVFPVRLTYSFRKPYLLINGLKPTPGPEPVYEFRNGVLVPGLMGTDGYFTASKDEKAIRFGDYRPGPFSRRIWNLPGEFVPQGGN